MPRLKVEGSLYDVDQHPDECPCCHHAMEPGALESIFSDNGRVIDAAFVCPRHKCSRMFIAIFERALMQGGSYSDRFYLRSTFPRNPLAPTIAPEVAKISPQFVEIFTQASKAEAFGLGEVAGVGYRKALEFLVKDYCVTTSPDKEDDVKKRPLGQVIETYVDNENIKQCAKRAVWLGNDETHYVRAWVDKDIKDLKLLIKLTVGWIEQAIITAILIEDMQKH
ncbi:hypothetical protein J2Y86_005625 [Pseudomonas migulae]|uniref:hypothetical protein n=1 Tax=Pseudomonas migulae TaxID=78543 RepID=UPI0020A11FBB|nr:hypothetical protein [Pseudomonas migulae]MCP1500918.1 hypothetical protein [Pseudomonas migulae]